MNLEILDTDLNKKKLISQPEFTEDTKERIKNAEILLIPEPDFRGEKGFPAGTPKFYKYLKKELSDYNIELCENKGGEKLIHRRSGEIWFPIIYIAITQVDLINLLSLIFNYIEGAMTLFKREKGEVHLKIVIADEKKESTKMLQYDGNPDGLSKSFKKIDVNSIFK